MSHECEVCGMECACDMDDCGGMEQPNDCPHFTRSGVCCGPDSPNDDSEVDEWGEAGA
jgi:hypothetical protein